VPVPAFYSANAAAARRLATKLHPGNRRPRWGGVVEGVAGQSRYPLAYDEEQTSEEAA